MSELPRGLPMLWASGGSNSETDNRVKAGVFKTLWTTFLGLHMIVGPHLFLKVIQYLCKIKNPAGGTDSHELKIAPQSGPGGGTAPHPVSFYFFGNIKSFLFSWGIEVLALFSKIV